MAIMSIPQMDDSVWNLKFVEHQFTVLYARPSHVEVLFLHLSGIHVPLPPWVPEKIHLSPQFLVLQSEAIRAKIANANPENESDL
jgi:hypothetical protein